MYIPTKKNSKYYGLALSTCFCSTSNLRIASFFGLQRQYFFLPFASKKRREMAKLWEFWRTWTTTVKFYFFLANVTFPHAGRVNSNKTALSDKTISLPSSQMPSCQMLYCQDLATMSNIELSRFVHRVKRWIVKSWPSCQTLNCHYLAIM